MGDLTSWQPVSFSGVTLLQWVDGLGRHNFLLKVCQYTFSFPFICIYICLYINIHMWSLETLQNPISLYPLGGILAHSRAVHYSSRVSVPHTTVCDRRPALIKAQLITSWSCFKVSKRHWLWKQGCRPVQFSNYYIC